MQPLRLCATEVFPQLCPTQNRYVATLRDPKKECCNHCDTKLVCCYFARPKYLQHIARQKAICDFARLKSNMLQICATKVICDFARCILRLCATRVATLSDTCCNFARPMLRLCEMHIASLRDACCNFARPMLQMCATKVICSTFATSGRGLQFMF